MISKENWTVLTMIGCLYFILNLVMVVSYKNQSCKSKKLKNVIIANICTSGVFIGFGIGNLVAMGKNNTIITPKDGYMIPVLVFMYGIIMLIMNANVYTETTEKCEELKYYVIGNVCLASIIFVVSSLNIFYVYKKNNPSTNK